MSMRRSALVLPTICLAVSGACGCSSGSTSAGGAGGEGGSAGTSSSSSAGAGTGGAGTSSGAGGGGTVVADCFQYTGWDGMTPVATFAADVLPVLRANCTGAGCHGVQNNPVPGVHFYGTPTSAGAMTPAQIQAIFAGAVGVTSVDESDMDVVKPGDPQHSFITYKLDGMDTTLCASLKCNATTACGYAMPYALPQLSLDTRNTIRRWIAQGAKNN